MPKDVRGKSNLEKADALEKLWAKMEQKLNKAIDSNEVSIDELTQAFATFVDTSSTMPDVLSNLYDNVGRKPCDQGK